jgi:ACS family hexuronate transporter-like MFS transporter
MTSAADEARDEKGAKVGGLRWLVITLIAVATVINYIDRNALAVMWPEISQELGYSKDDYALLLTWFMVFYAVGQSVFGRVFDAIGTRFGFVLAIMAWSAAIAAHALARTLLVFSLLRAALGLSEAGAWPGAAKANAEWFPAAERSLAQGVFNAGASVGAIISAPLIAFLFLNVGWQAVFVIIGALGALWLVPWLFIYRAPPERHPWLSEAERARILAGRAEPQQATPKPGLAALLARRESWGIILSRFFLDPVWWLFVSWLPIYLADVFGFDIRQIGLFAWVPYVGAALGSLIGGGLAGVFIRRGMSAISARKLVIFIGAIIMLPALLGSMQAADPLLAVSLIAVVLFGFQVAIGNIQTLPSDYLDESAVGSLAGLSGTAAIAGVLITTWIVPAATKTSYVPFFLLGAALVPLSMIAIQFLCPTRPNGADTSATGDQ